MPDTEHKFSEHLYDPLRIEIGLTLISRELCKIYPNKSYDNVKALVNGHFPLLNTDDKIRHFWNQVNNFSLGLWQKNITKYVTSKNYIWTEIDDMEVNDIKLNWDFEGRLPFKGRTLFQAKEYLDQNPTIKIEQIEICDRQNNDGDKRRLDRIIAIKSIDGLSVLDGHGRLMNMLLNNRTRIKAYLGEENKLVHHDDWIATEYLLRLVLDRSYSQLAHILKFSPNALTEFKYFLPIDEKLKSKILRNINLLNNSYNLEKVLNKIILRF